MNNNYPFAPENFSLTPEYTRRMRDSINFAMRGKTNNTGEITLTTSSTTTVVADNNCNENSVILLMPLTLNAAQHIQHTYVTAGDKQFTINHQSNVQTDRTFRYVIVG